MIGGIGTVLSSWLVAQAVALTLGIAPVCWWSSLLMGLLGCVSAHIPLSRGDKQRPVLASIAAGLFLLWPLGLTARLFLMLGVLFLMHFTWQLEHRSMRRAVWKRYLSDRGLVILYSSLGEVLMESAALKREGTLAEALKRHAYTHFHQLDSVIPIEHAGRHLLMTVTRVPLPTGEVRYWNRGAVELYGHTARNTISRFEPLLLASRYPAPPDALREQVCQAGSWQGVVARTTAVGETKLVEVRWTVLRDEAGRPTDIVELSSDVTATLRDSRRRQQLAAIVESTDDAVISLSLSGETLSYNHGWATLPRTSN
ncbi:MAG: hypothetical protein DDT39_00259 [Firmicutes bacterium]|nr:hypothetical protein [candidate division NPL-UPA2 bacterium]